MSYEVTHLFRSFYTTSFTVPNVYYVVADLISELLSHSVK